MILSTAMQQRSTERCTRIKKDGEQCKSYSVKGSMVCRMHGGSLPNVRRSAEFRMQRDKAQQEVLARLKAEKASRVEIVSEMDRLAAEVIAWKDVVREQLESLTVDEWRYEGKTGEQLHAIVALYERCLTSCNAVLSTNVKLNIAERRVELDKAKAILVAGVIRAIIGRLDLSPEQQQLAPRVIQEEMLALSAEVS